MKRILCAFLLALALPCWAATYYVSDCQTGADAACVAGSDASGTPTNPATPLLTFGAAVTKLNAAVPGDQILFAKGGAWNPGATAYTIYNTNGGNAAAMFANPVIVGSYTPSWGPGTAQPVITSSNNSAGTALLFHNGTAAANGGIVYQDLKFVGTTTNTESTVFWFYNSISHVTMQRLTIDGFGANAIMCIAASASSRPSKIKILQNTLNNNGRFAIGSFGCFDVLIDRNTADNNGYNGGFLNHTFYVSGAGQAGATPARNVTISNNTITRNTHNSGQCTSTAIVGHDAATDWLIENNYLYQAPGTSSANCTGITLGPANGGGEVEGETRATVRGNLLVNMGTVGIELDACQACTIEDNVNVWETDAGRTYGVRGIRSLLPGVSPVYTTGISLNVRNNTIVIATTADESIAIEIKGNGSTHKIVSNLIYFGSAASIDSCFYTTSAFSAFSNWDNNLCRQNGASWFPGSSTKAAFTTASGLGFDTNSLTSDPLFVATPALANGFSCALQSGSPAIDAGHATLSSRSGFHGQTIKGVRRNMGGCED